MTKERWTAAEIKKLKAGIARDLSYGAIGAKIGKSAASCRSKAAGMGILRPRRNFAIPKWTDAANCRLMELREQDELGWEEIGADLDMSPGACQSQYDKLKSRRLAGEGFVGLARTVPNATLLEYEKRQELRRQRDERDFARGIITAAFNGDPEPGRSALDKRRAQGC